MEERDPAIRAVLDYLRTHGTINRLIVEQLFGFTRMAAMAVLDRMHKNGHIQRHGHDGIGAFYTVNKL